MTDTPCRVSVEERCVDWLPNQKGQCRNRAKFNFETPGGWIRLCGTHKNQRAWTAAHWGEEPRIEELR